MYMYRVAGQVLLRSAIKLFPLNPGSSRAVVLVPFPSPHRRDKMPEKSYLKEGKVYFWLPVLEVSIQTLSTPVFWVGTKEQECSA